MQQPRYTKTRKGGLARVAGALLFVLAAYAAITSVASLLSYSEPKSDISGIVILIAGAVVMPWLGKEKGRLSRATSSTALRADAAQSRCVPAYHASRWQDWRSTPSDMSSMQTRCGLSALRLIAWEGREAVRAKACECCYANLP